MRRRKGEERYEQKKMAGSRRRGAALPCSDGLWKRWRRTAGFLRRAAGVRAGTGTGDTDNRRDDAYNVKVEKDRENDISIWQVEFETDYGDYEYEIASADGRIVGADYEVDEEWLDSLGGSPVDEDGARSIAAGKAGGASADEVQIWQESDDGRSRFEGELFWNGIKYEFELDAQTGIIFDWNADMREYYSPISTLRNSMASTVRITGFTIRVPFLTTIPAPR